MIKAPCTTIHNTSAGKAKEVPYVIVTCTYFGWLAATADVDMLEASGCLQKGRDAGFTVQWMSPRARIMNIPKKAVP